MASLAIALPVGGGRPRKSIDPPLAALPCRRRRRECEVPPLGIGVQAIQLSPYHAGLAGRHLWRLPVTPAFPACCCHLGLSPSGKPMAQEQSSEFLLAAPGIQHRVPRRTVSHHPAQAWNNASWQHAVFGIGSAADLHDTTPEPAPEGNSVVAAAPAPTVAVGPTFLRRCLTPVR